MNSFSRVLVILPGVVGLRPIARPSVRQSVSVPATSIPEAPPSTAPQQTDRPSWDNAAWAQGFNTPEAELSDPIAGNDLPADLVGTYYRNGHAKFEVGDERVMHPFDADGMVSAATFFGDGSLYFRNRYIRTRPFQKELLAGKMLYSGRFGNARPVWEGLMEGGTTKLKNVANTNVIWWSDRLLALWEGGRPHKIDPLSLGTAGPTDLSGVLGPSNPLNAMAAYPRIDPVRNRLVCFESKDGNLLKLYEFDKDFNLALEDVGVKTLPEGLSLFADQDAAVTANWVVFAASPEGQGTAAGSQGLDRLFGKTQAPLRDANSDASQTCLVLFRRDGSDNGTPVVIKVDATFNLRFVNAYENDQNQLVIDTIRANRVEMGSMVAGKPAWETVNYAQDVPKSTLVRHVVDTGTRSVVSQSVLSNRHQDFPVINPRVSCGEHRYVWAATGCSASDVAPPQGVVKVDTRDSSAEQVWLPEPHEFCGEPCFARRRPNPDSTGEATPAEDDGYILTLVVNGRDKTTDLVVLDAAQVAQGPIARVPLGVNLPHGLHGCWTEEISPDLAQLQNAKVLLNLYMRKSKEWNQMDGAFSGMGIGQFFGQKGIDGR